MLKDPSKVFMCWNRGNKLMILLITKVELLIQELTTQILNIIMAMVPIIQNRHQTKVSIEIWKVHHPDLMAIKAKALIIGENQTFMGSPLRIQHKEDQCKKWGNYKKLGKIGELFFYQSVYFLELLRWFLKYMKWILDRWEKVGKFWEWAKRIDFQDDLL